MIFAATKQKVYNRGAPPDEFLEELVAFGKLASPDIFAPNSHQDIYAATKEQLGPWHGNEHRRAVMLENLRVLAGFESSWHFGEGRDSTAPSGDPWTYETGAWQVSGDAMNHGSELKECVRRHDDNASINASAFQTQMRLDRFLAIEFIVRLLRRTTKHHGPLKRSGEDSVYPWLRRDAVDEFMALIAAP